MENNETNFELNNPAPAPIPEPLPELTINRKNGGFNGAKNRFCSNVTPVPMQNKTPSFALDKNEEHQDSISYTEKAVAERSQKPDFEAEVAIKPQATPDTLSDDTSDTASDDMIDNTPDDTLPSFAKEPISKIQEPAVNNATMGKYNLPQTEKKSHTGVVVLISVITTIMVLTATFFAYILWTGDKSNTLFEGLFPNNRNTQTQEAEPDSYQDFFDNAKDNASGNDKGNQGNHATQDYTNKKWKGIDLKPQPSKKKPLTVQKDYELISKSTVSVLCFADEITDDENYAESQGTGTIISSDGYIVTNSHVVGNSKSLYLYQVVDDNGKKYTASVVGYDTRTDIAVLKINAKNLKFATFGSTDSLKVGDDVISVGDSGGIGFHDSLTKGIVSGKDRKLTSSNIKYIQIDAAVNPGNSGGPICNMFGQVIGMTTAKINSVSYEGMGFAIPSETIKAVADDLIRQGYVNGRVQIGITGIAIDTNYAETYKVPQGIAIAQILETGSLAGTDVKEGDIITEIDGKRISSFSEVYSILENHKPGDKIEIQFYRVDQIDPRTGEYFTTTIKLVSDKGENQE